MPRIRSEAIGNREQGTGNRNGQGTKSLPLWGAAGPSEPASVRWAAACGGSDEVPNIAPRAYVEIVVVPAPRSKSFRATRTSSVFGKTMQAFFAESTFPIGEGYFWRFYHLPHKSGFVTTFSIELPCI